MIGTVHESREHERLVKKNVRIVLPAAACIKDPLLELRELTLLGAAPTPRVTQPCASAPTSTPPTGTCLRQNHDVDLVSVPANWVRISLSTATPTTVTRSRPEDGGDRGGTAAPTIPYPCSHQVEGL